MSIFTPENGFVVDSGLGYDEKGRNRLNGRYRTFLEPNAHRIKGKRVLDLASHDGRWTFAALMNGAAHVTGVEFRQELIEKAHYIITPEMHDRVRFLQGDIFDVLPRMLEQGKQFDIILCLGIFYHVMDHHRLVKLMAAFKANLIIVDTVLIDSADPFIKLRTEPSNRFRNAAPDFADQQEVPIGVVSRGGVRLLARTCGYSLRYAEWKRSAVENPAGLGDYFWTDRTGARRYTFYLEPKETKSAS
jgi:hypothetical protein